MRRQDLPTEADLNEKIKWFWDSRAAVAEFTNWRAWSAEWIKKARLGLDNGALFMPVFGLHENQLINCRWRKWKKEDMAARGPKKWGPRGRRPSLYPLWLIDQQKPLVIVEGEMDAGALHSIGVNAITYMGGAKTLSCDAFRPVLPKPGPGSCVILCVDQDREGRKAEQRLRRELYDYGIEEIQLVEVPEPSKDIEEHLRRFMEEDRPKAWQELLKKATVYGGEKCIGNGVYIHDGALVDEDGNELAPWTGCVVLTGKARYGTSEGASTYVFELTYKGTQKTKRVHYEVGTSFRDAILGQCGPAWAISKKVEDLIFTSICVATGELAKHQDNGFIFGFEQRDRATFWAPGTSFRLDGPFDTDDEIRMEPTVNAMRNLALFKPEPDLVSSGVELVLRYLYKSHKPNVMGLMIASALAAPVRRLFFSNDQSFNVLIYGHTGCGKTSRAREVANLYSGLITDDQQLPSWRSSPKYVEELMTKVGDSWLLVDEFRPHAMSMGSRKEAISILQGIAQGGGRHTMSSDRRMIASGESNCVLACTMESLPSDDDSMLARSVLIPVPTIEILAPEWKTPHDKVIKNRDFLPYALSGWVQWMFCSPKEGEPGSGVTCERAIQWANQVCSEIIGLYRADWMRIPNSPRVFQRAVMLTSIWKMFLDFAVSPNVAAIDAGYHQALVDEWLTEVLFTYFKNSFCEIDAAGAVEDFFSALESAVESGEVAFHYRNGPRSKADAGKIFPSWARIGAPVVGELIPSWDKVEQEAVVGDNQRYVIRLKSSVAAALQTRLKSRMTWKDVTQQLRTNKLMTEGSVTTAAMNRVFLLSKRGGMRLLPVLLGTLE